MQVNNTYLVGNLDQIFQCLVVYQERLLVRVVGHNFYFTHVYLQTPDQRTSQKCSQAPAVAPCSASVIDMKFKLKVAANVKIINEATKILRPLHNDVDNFVLFESEVEENLMTLIIRKALK